jgi:hypothetical protein
MSAVLIAENLDRPRSIKSSPRKPMTVGTVHYEG